MWKFFIYFFIIIFWELLISNGDINEGEFNIIIKEFGPCDDSISGTKEIQMNTYLIKRSKTETKVAGNLTNSIPYDDNLQIELNFWRFHNERGFQKIPLTLKFNRACSDSRLLWGKEWNTMFRSTRNGNVGCSIPNGVHILSGLNVEQIIKQKTNFLPTQLIYGRYKVTASFLNKRNKKIVGCVYGVANFKPDWKRITSTD